MALHTRCRIFELWDDSNLPTSIIPVATYASGRHHVALCLLA